MPDEIWRQRTSQCRRVPLLRRSSAVIKRRRVPLLRRSSADDAGNSLLLRSSGTREIPIRVDHYTTCYVLRAAFDPCAESIQLLVEPLVAAVEVANPTHHGMAFSGQTR